MKSKIFYIAILTVFLVSTVCFLPQNVFATQNNLCITFEYGDKTYVYDQSQITFDKYNLSIVSGLQKRGFFEDNKTKYKIAKEVMSLGFDEIIATKYILVGIDKLFAQIKNDVYIQKQDSQIIFDTSLQHPFVISEGVDGVAVDEKTLCKNIIDKLQNSNSFSVSVPVTKIKAITKNDNLAKTRLKAVFATNYQNSSQNRKDNIALAFGRFDGMVVEPEQQVSFNQVVGKRTEQNGFKSAKVISFGKYVDGIGGGVCQASTTLYNALLRAGLQIDEWHRHTLKSSYVPPSFDAMVNDNGADLVFTNNTAERVFLKTKCDGTNATVWIYGLQNEFDFKTESVVEQITKAKEQIVADEKGEYQDKVLFEDESFCLQNPVDGVKSKGYLVATKNGKIVWKKLIRTDNYATVDKIVVKGVKKRDILPEKATI